MSDINEAVKDTVEEVVVEAAKESLTGAGAAVMGLTIIGGITVVGGVVYGGYRLVKHFTGKKKDKAEEKPEETDKKDENFKEVDEEQQEETE